MIGEPKRRRRPKRIKGKPDMHLDGVPVYKTKLCPKTTLYRALRQRHGNAEVIVRIEVHPDRWDEFARELRSVLKDRQS